MDTSMTRAIDLNWIEPDDLQARHHLGVGLALGFERLRFLMAPRRSQSRALSRGQFLYALACPRAASDLNAPASTELLTDRLIVLRVRALETIPDEGQRQATLCQRLLTATLPLDAPWDRDEDNWGVIDCDVLGSYSPPEPNTHRPLFSAGLSLSFPAACHHLYAPSNEIMEMLTNGTVNPINQIELGLLRNSEDRMYQEAAQPTRISMADIKGKRTAMFGKTRLGKSNVVKLVVQGMLDVTAHRPDVGQIIFDVNGEYANANPQDGDTALAHVYKTRCITYFLTDLKGNPDARLLRFNLYQRSEEALAVISEVLSDDVRENSELKNLFTCRLPKLVRLPQENEIEFRRKARKLMLFWAVLNETGCEHDSDHMKEWLLAQGLNNPFNPGFSQAIRTAAFMEVMNKPAPSIPFDFLSMALEMRTVARFAHIFRNDPCLNPHGQYVFDSDEQIMIGILTSNDHALDLLRPCVYYHDPRASNFTTDILQALSDCKTVIVDLSSAPQKILRYFATNICTSIFREQERKFVSNSINDRYVQIYFEEAHNIFPSASVDTQSIYSRFAKEGAKFNIGIVYSTQSPSTVNKDLLAQTENFFIGHLSASTDTNYLSDVQRAFSGCELPIMQNRTAGFMQILTFSHRYVVPVQAHRYSGKSRVCSDANGAKVSGTG